VKVAIAARGYWIQSHILQIPNRFGFFSPGPPLLQEFEGGWFVVALVLHAPVVFISAFIVGLLSLQPDHPPLWRITTALAVLLATSLAAVWILMATNGRRAPDYDWGNLKLRKE